MNMVEKVARALAVADGKDPDAPAWIRYPGGSPFGVCWHDQYSSKARAAIEALREPTDAMIEAGKVLAVETPPHDITGEVTAWHVYTSMIDTALQEQTGN